MMNRRELLAASFAAIVAARIGTAAASVPVASPLEVGPPTESKANFVAWMQKNRGEDPTFLAQRWDLYVNFIGDRTYGASQASGRSC